MSGERSALEVSYRSAMQRLPGGVAVIAARSGGRDIAAVVTSLVSVSLEPPTVLVVIHGSGRLADVLDVGSEWAASVMAAGQEGTVAWIAEPGRPDIGQLRGVEFRPGELTGAAILDSAAWLECRTRAVYPEGDHLVIVARVLAAGVGARDGALVHRLGRVRDVTAG